MLRSKQQKKINGKRARETGTYRIIGKSKDSEWAVVRGAFRFKTPNSLINSKIIVTNEKKVVQGTVVKASIVGGGATGPATEGGLPPVDE